MAPKKTKPEPEVEEVVGESWPDVIARIGGEGLAANRALEAETNVSPVMVGEEAAPDDEADEAETKVVKKAETK